MENDTFIIAMILNQWESKVRLTTELFESLGEKSAMEPVATGRNRVVYLLGHLVAVHDRLFDALELGSPLYPELDQLFLTPQHLTNEYPPFAELITKWSVVNDLLSAKLKAMTVANWLEKHHYVSEEEFQTQPQRNKLNVLLSRISHIFHHSGQLVLVRQT